MRWRGGRAPPGAARHCRQQRRHIGAGDSHRRLRDRRVEARPVRQRRRALLLPSSRGARNAPRRRRLHRQHRVDPGADCEGRLCSIRHLEARHGRADTGAALDHAKDGIRVNAVGPGHTHTPLLDRVIDAETRRALEADYPSGRFATPSEIAGMVASLASDAASFATGGFYAVDGGYLAR
jgi:hypothetical protein